MKVRMFPSKKSDVFDFRKGPAFRHSTRLQIRGANRRKHHQQKLFGFVLRYMPENGLQNAADCLFCFRDFEGFGGFPRPTEEHFQTFIAFRWAEIQTPLQLTYSDMKTETENTYTLIYSPLALHRTKVCKKCKTKYLPRQTFSVYLQKN